MVQEGKLRSRGQEGPGCGETGPHRLARPRTSASQAEDRGSNPLGAVCKVAKKKWTVDAISWSRELQDIVEASEDKVPTGALSFFVPCSGNKGHAILFSDDVSEPTLRRRHGDALQVSPGERSRI